MTPLAFPIVPLDDRDRSGFDCGTTALNRYFVEQVGQDVRRSVARCHVALSPETGEIAAFYTAAAAEISVADLPPDISRRLPRYPTVPAVRIGRLAVDLRYRGRGLGPLLLVHAAGQAVRSSFAVFALVVDAKDEGAAGFYRHHGLVSFGSAPLQFFAPLTALLGR